MKEQTQYRQIKDKTMSNTHNEDFLNTSEDDKTWDALLGSKEGQELLSELADKALKEAGLVKPEDKQ
jgi:hypothetical protein